MLKLLLASLAVSSASVLEPKKAAQPALRLRGGGGLGSAILTMSAAAAGSTGALMYIGKEDLASLLWLNLNQWPADKMLGSAVVGWAVGKFICARNGLAKEYCQLNIVPMLLMILANVMGGGPMTANLLPACFTAAYVYVGFVED